MISQLSFFYNIIENAFGIAAILHGKNSQSNSKTKRVKSPKSSLHSNFLDGETPRLDRRVVVRHVAASGPFIYLESINRPRWLSHRATEFLVLELLEVSQAPIVSGTTSPQEEYLYRLSSYIVG
ncbi:hypothetical protein HHI36_021535 [Cryptolaemus montrouzieri]|uniref:Uncharacterized protein n=1 Tax=Cryptolaemus montrouzieri TaxID=559131 RepID=A0ABD2MX04_9CUCU